MLRRRASNLKRGSATTLESMLTRITWDPRSKSPHGVAVRQARCGSPPNRRAECIELMPWPKGEGSLTRIRVNVNHFKMT